MSKRKPSLSEKVERPSVLEHELVPKHEVLSAEEAAELLRRYRVTPTQLPSILHIDPVVRELGAKPGDIIKITRRSPTAGEYIYYRVVVKAS